MDSSHNAYKKISPPVGISVKFVLVVQTIHEAGGGKITYLKCASKVEIELKESGTLRPDWVDLISPSFSSCVRLLYKLLP